MNDSEQALYPSCNTTVKGGNVRHQQRLPDQCGMRNTSDLNSSPWREPESGTNRHTIAGENVTGISGVVVAGCWILLSLSGGSLQAAEGTPVNRQSAVEQVEATGSVTGTVIYEPDPQRPWRYGRYYLKDQNRGALAEVVVALTGLPPDESDSQTDPATVVVDQQNFQFVPETVAIRAGDHIRFLNSDQQVHNVRTSHPRHSFNVSLSPGNRHTETFRHAGGLRQPYRIGCVFHSAMRAWVFVFDHPHFQVTEADGRFQLTHIPAGKYRLELIHPAGQLRWQQQIQVQADQPTSVNIRLSPDNVQKRRSQ